MNDKDLQLFKQLLQKLKIELTKAAKTSAEAEKTVTLDQTSVGRLSRMGAMQSQAMAQESKRRRFLQLTRIDAALERMAEEEYGYCAECDEDIDKRRLLVDPAAPFCVSCAEKL